MKSLFVLGNPTSVLDFSMSFCKEEEQDEDKQRKRCLKLLSNACCVRLRRSKHSDTAMYTLQLNQLDSLLFSFALENLHSLWWRRCRCGRNDYQYNDLAFAFTTTLLTSHFNQHLLHGICYSDNVYASCSNSTICWNTHDTAILVLPPASLNKQRTRLFLVLPQLNIHNSHRLMWLKFHFFTKMQPRMHSHVCNALKIRFRFVCQYFTIFTYNKCNKKWLHIEFNTFFNWIFIHIFSIISRFLTVSFQLSMLLWVTNSSVYVWPYYAHKTDFSLGNIQAYA